MSYNSFLNLECKSYGTYYEKGACNVNEDSLAFNIIKTIYGEALLAIICDGSDSINNGEAISGFLCEQISIWFYKQFCLLWYRRANEKAIINDLIKTIFQLHNKILDYTNMAKSTIDFSMSMLLVHNNIGLIVNLGNSSIYKIKDANILLTPSNLIDNDSNDFKLLNNLFIKQIKIDNKDKFLICSDGYSNKIIDSDIISLNGSNIEKKLKTIGRRNINNGETDNMSAIFISY